MRQPRPNPNRRGVHGAPSRRQEACDALPLEHRTDVEGIPGEHDSCFSAGDDVVFGRPHDHEQRAQVRHGVSHERQEGHHDASRRSGEQRTGEAEAGDVEPGADALSQRQRQVHVIAVGERRHLSEEVGRPVAKSQQRGPRHVFRQRQPPSNVAHRRREVQLRRQRQRQEDQQLWSRSTHVSGPVCESVVEGPLTIHANSANTASASGRCLATTEQ